MATQRIISTEKTILDQDQPPEQALNITPAVPKHVIFKLLGFTLAMIVVPIGSYFATVDAVFKGNTSYAGATAAVLANVVLICYIVVTVNEDSSDKSEKHAESKKDR